MRAGELWWSGKNEAFQASIEKTLPPSLNIVKAVQAAEVRTGKYREGVAYKADQLKDLRPISRHITVWSNAKMIELATEEAISRSMAALEKLDEHLTNFRSRINNDLTSIKAASQRVQTEAQSMGEKYTKARDLLTSPEFERAIENAERMATALESIGRLSETRLSVAVFSGGQNLQKESE